MNNPSNFRCNCPVTCALDIIGDKWLLVIVKQMLIEHKQTFKDFTESDEAIATNILTTKLKLLVSYGLAKKSKLPNNKKSVYYHLTDRGLSLAPIIMELAIWSSDNLSDENQQMIAVDFFQEVKKNKDKFIHDVINNYKNMVSALTIL